LIKNSQPFGKKLSENRRGDFLTHTVLHFMGYNFVAGDSGLSSFV